MVCMMRTQFDSIVRMCGRDDWLKQEGRGFVRRLAKAMR
jgi:hypothetical protein